MKPNIEDFSNELDFQVGNRVHVELRDVPKKWRNMETGVIVNIDTHFAHTPEMRRFAITVRLDGDQKYWSGIGPIISVFQKQLTKLKATP